MSKLNTTICMVLFFMVNVNAQSKFTFPSSTDLGLNITNVLTSFIGNSNGEVDIESFPFVVKLNRKNNTVRFGLGVNLGNSSETITEVEQFIFNNYQLNARVGYERKKYLGHKFGFFYGVDLVSTWQNEESTFSNNIDVTNISVNTIGVGVGPVYGFEYYLNKHMYIGTEGSFYGIYRLANRTESFEFKPKLNTERSSTSFSARLTTPTRLYIMVRF